MKIIYNRQRAILISTLGIILAFLNYSIFKIEILDSISIVIFSIGAIELVLFNRQIYKNKLLQLVDMGGLFIFAFLLISELFKIWQLV